MANRKKFTTKVYDDVIGNLYKMEEEAKKEIEKNDELSKKERKAQLNYVTSKYEILRITSAYGMLLSTMSLYDGFIHAFMHSSENRRMFLVDHSIKVCVDETSKQFGKIVSHKNEKFKKKKYPEWVEWKGCLMKIPENTYITISANATWPTVYMKSKAKDSDTYNEIAIYERSWNADVYTTEPGLVKRLRYEEEEPLEQGVCRLVLDNDTGGNTKFTTVDLAVQRKLKEYDIVLDIPFRAPFMDVLTKVNFKDSEANPELLMTFAMT